MRRWRAILLCLLAGAVVNVLVAWGCARRCQGLPAGRWTNRPGGAWPVPVPGAWPEPARTWSARAAGADMVGGDTVGRPQAGFFFVHVVRGGWPLRSFAAVDRSSPFRRGLRMRSWEEGLMWTRLRQGSYATLWLPVRPLWPGLVVNTLVFATGACAAARVPGLCRGALRRRRGLCPRCAYDLVGVTGPCPECGAQP